MSWTKDCGSFSSLADKIELIGASQNNLKIRYPRTQQFTAKTNSFSGKISIYSSNKYFSCHCVNAKEAVSQRCSVEKVFLKILQNSQQNTCARVAFLIKLQASPSFLQNTSVKLLLRFTLVSLLFHRIKTCQIFPKHRDKIFVFLLLSLLFCKKSFQMDFHFRVYLELNRYLS